MMGVLKFFILNPFSIFSFHFPSLSLLFLSFLFFSLSSLSQKNLIYVRISRENFSFCEHENLVWLLNEPELVFSNYSYHGWSTPAATLKTVNIKRLQNTVSCLRSSIWPIRRPESRIDAIATELKGGAWERPHILRTFSSKYSVLHLNQNGITSWIRQQPATSRPCVAMLKIPGSPSWCKKLMATAMAMIPATGSTLPAVEREEKEKEKIAGAHRSAVIQREKRMIKEERTKLFPNNYFFSSHSLSLLSFSYSFIRIKILDQKYI